MRIAINIVELVECSCTCPFYQHTPEGGLCTKVGEYTGRNAGFPAICPLEEEY